MLPNGNYWDAELFDPDGPGPAVADLIVVGDFSGLGDTSTQITDLGRWDGSAWRRFPHTTFNSTALYALGVFDFDGNGLDPARLVVGGACMFSTIRDGQILNIFATDGEEALRLGAGLNQPVRAIHVFDPDGEGPIPSELYAAGSFTASGQTTIGPVARWSGTEWVAPAPGLTRDVSALGTFDFDGDGPLPPRLIAVGGFSIDGVGAAVAMLQDGAWVRVGGSLGGSATSMTSFDFDGPGGDPARLVVAGPFQGGPVLLRGAAYFEGESWRPLVEYKGFPPFPQYTCRAVAAFDLDGPGPLPERLVVAGDGSGIPRAGDSNRYELVEYLNGEYSPILRESNGNINTMKQIVLPGSDDPMLLLVGSFSRTQFEPLYISTFDGNEVRPFSTGFSESSAYAFGVTRINGRPQLIVSGSLRYSVTPPRNGVWVLGDGGWEPLGEPAGDTTAGRYALISYDPDEGGPMSEIVVVGGLFDAFAGIPARRVAMYDGVAWRAMGEGMVNAPRDFVVHDPDGDGPLARRLIACEDSSGVDPRYLRAWDGAQWVIASPPFTNGPSTVILRAMTTVDLDGDGPAPNMLVVHGGFTQVGDVNVSNIALFDGTSWMALPAGSPTLVQSAGSWDRAEDGREVLVIGGYSALTPGEGSVAMWDGVAWSQLGETFGVNPVTGGATLPWSFASIHGDLYTSGNFSISGRGPANGIARWNREAWEGLNGGGVDNPSLSNLEVIPAAGSEPATVVIAGTFQSAGGLSNSFVARYAVPVCCGPDFNSDGTLNSQDFFAFVTAFFGNDRSADYNADGTVNSQDFFDFLGAFFVGC